MPTGAIVRPNDYHDSVFLMRAARRVTAEPGITQASAVMGSEQNKRLLAESGLAAAGIDAAGPNDLILALKGATREAVEAALARADEWLRPEEGPARDFHGANPGRGHGSSTPGQSGRHLAAG